MKIFNFVKAVLLLVVVVGMCSCGDEYYVDYQNTNEKLCNKDWIENVDVNTDEWYKHILRFNEDGTFSETKAYYRNDESEPYRTVQTHKLGWSWADDAKERLILEYNNVSYVYFDNVMLREHYLTGVLEGVSVMFNNYNSVW